MDKMKQLKPYEVLQTSWSIYFLNRQWDWGRISDYCSFPFCSRTPQTKAHWYKNTDLHSGSNVKKCLRVKRFPFFWQNSSYLFEIDFCFTIKYCFFLIFQVNVLLYDYLLWLSSKSELLLLSYHEFLFFYTFLWSFL